MSGESADIHFTNHAGAAFEVILLGAGNDTIDSSAFSGNVAIYGYGGNDTLIGGLGNDWLDGMDGDDTLIGNGGDDALVGFNALSGNPADSGVDKMLGGG